MRRRDLREGKREREKGKKKGKKGTSPVFFASIMISPERSFSIRLDRFVIDRWMATSRAAFLR